MIGEIQIEFVSNYYLLYCHVMLCRAQYCYGKSSVYPSLRDIEAL